MNRLTKIHFAFFLSFSFLLGNVEHTSAQTRIIMITEMGVIPPTMTFKKGESVELVVHNQNHLVRTFTIPALQVSSPLLMKGEMASIRFTPDQPGEFNYHAHTVSFGNERYTGVLTITENE